MTDRKTASGSRNASWFGFTFDWLSMLLRCLFSIFLLPIAGAALIGFAACSSHSPAVESKRIPLLGVDTNLTRIVIHKSKYKLELYEKDKLLRSYPVVLGSDPVTDKFQEGDGRTPEGIFHVRTKYDHARWSKFIWVDYPTDESYRRFADRKARGLIPKDGTIGGEIGIHGVPDGMDDLIAKHENWTLGCISLTRADVEELYGLIRTGTEIRILH